MRTIEYAAREYAAKERTTRSEHAAFVDGVRWSQRWISVEEELPNFCDKILVKRKTANYFLAGMPE